MTTITIPFDERRSALAHILDTPTDPASALAALNLPPYRGVIAVHGGAGGMEQDCFDAVRHLLATSVIPLAQRFPLLVIDGATHVGTARILGDLRERAGASFPLLGVMPHRFALYLGGPPADEQRYPLNPGHSHFLFVPGEEFGAESELMVGLLRASGRPGLALIINGGLIVLDEARRHAQAGNLVVVVRGSGRMADALADPGSAERASLPPEARLAVVGVDQPEQTARLILQVLGADQAGA